MSLARNFLEALSLHSAPEKWKPNKLGGVELFKKKLRIIIIGLGGEDNQRGG